VPTSVNAKSAGKGRSSKLGKEAAKRAMMQTINRRIKTLFKATVSTTVKKTEKHESSVPRSG
jgi:hypothetical protein